MLSICSDHFSPTTMTNQEVDLLLELSSRNQFRNLEMLELLQGSLSSALIGCPGGVIISLLKFQNIRIADILQTVLLSCSRRVGK